MKYCTNCGTPNDANTNFCSSCGQSLNQGVNSNISAAPVNGMIYYGKPKKGKAIASMVLGIIAIVWASFSVLYLGNMNDVLNEVMAEGDVTADSVKAAAIIVFCSINIICGTLGLIFGLIARKNGKAIAGIITSTLALITALITIIVIMSVEL